MYKKSIRDRKKANLLINEALRSEQKIMKSLNIKKYKTLKKSKIKKADVGNKQPSYPITR